MESSGELQDATKNGNSFMMTRHQQRSGLDVSGLEFANKHGCVAKLECGREMRLRMECERPQFKCTATIHKSSFLHPLEHGLSVLESSFCSHVRFNCFQLPTKFIPDFCLYRGTLLGRDPWSNQVTERHASVSRHVAKRPRKVHTG